MALGKKALVLWAGVLFLAGPAVAEGDSLRFYRADKKDVETAWKLVMQRKTLTVNVMGYRGVTFLTRVPFDVEAGGGDATFGFTTWIELAQLDIHYQIRQEKPGETALELDLTPLTTSRAIYYDLLLIKEDILTELHTQVDYELGNILALKAIRKG